MIPLLFAAALAVSSPSPDVSAPAPAVKFTPFSSLRPDQLEHLSPGSREKLAYAGVFCQKKAVQTAGPSHAPLKKLGDLPPALLEHAVNRLVNGCPVREIFGGGRTYYLDMNTPTVERIDPIAYPAGQH